MVKLAILGCAEIAFRRFMPAVKNVKNIEVVAVGEEYDKNKLYQFCETYSVRGYSNFKEMINCEELDGVYIPQPPSLHYMWAKYALEMGLHVIIEKPSTTNYVLSNELVNLASQKKLVIHENYMFQYHSQIETIKKMLGEGCVGNVRLIRMSFGFPLRESNDFRYNKSLGGGALLDAGGYPVKLAYLLLGDSIRVVSSTLNNIDGYEVDMYGSATLTNDDGLVCQIGFGMDAYYQCSIEIWGSRGMLCTDRIFTAPPDYKPKVVLKTSEGISTIELEADSHFEHSIEQFTKEIEDGVRRKKMYKEIILQSKLIQDIRNDCEKDSDL